MQRNNPDDLIVNDISDASGNFSGTGVWKDSGGIETGTYRYEIVFNGMRKTGGNIMNPLQFFRELNSKIPSPAEENITISGRVLYKDKAPIEGARVRIWKRTICNATTRMT